jgi:hypothetical protein
MKGVERWPTQNKLKQVSYCNPQYQVECRRRGMLVYCFYSSSIKRQEEDLVEESIVEPLVMRSHGTSMVTSLLFVRVVSVGGERV